MGRGDKKRRSDALSKEDHGAVFSRWEIETTVSPNKQDVKQRRILAKEHGTHATHYLQVSQLEFHAHFREANEQSEVGLRAFELLKPLYVRQLKERNACVCRFHYKMTELRTGWNNMRTATRGIHGHHCECDC
ncbi:hypothetical protein KC19_VG103400 [Ceratodon purpureus]|uniref:Uncharacterized protein n=1 Tax=Ceratodon purpureus TaxID=3225 RepID=A0A8T0HP52_CERPU|nr:hypothetical protein KC19_VG103400 [Ceratodon purpureus]